MVVGDYHILAPLGRGGMGTVYLAKSLANPAWPPYPRFPLVALKVLPPKKAKEEPKKEESVPAAEPNEANNEEKMDVDTEGEAAPMQTD